MNKNKIVLIILFVFPIITYLIFASAKHNSLFLPTISENNKEIPSSWKTLSGNSIQLKNKITILGFLGDNAEEYKGNLFNLNQKIYNKYFGFKDFQIVMIAPEGNQEKYATILKKMAPLSEDLSGWHFVFAPQKEIINYHKTFKLIGKLDDKIGTSEVIIIDKEKNHRGRIGKNKAGENEYRESYNTVSAADLHNEMTDDVKIVLREYRLALKKHKRKDSFRDEIIKKVKENEK